ncbi:MAG: glycosyltransferase, partial [Lachnospiraceae bacterium]|nr:glycosyltransferase [Lachnospiraceae bacterium]
MKTVINYLGDRIGNGGVEALIANLSTAIDKEKIDFKVVANYKSNNIYNSFFDENDICVIYLNEDYRGFTDKIKKAYSFFKNHQDAILWIHASSAGMYQYVFLAHVAGVKKIVYHIHAIAEARNTGWRRYKNNIMGKICWKIPALNVACSKYAGEKAFCGHAFKVIHNGIDIKRFEFNCQARDEIRSKYEIGNYFLIGQIGRLSYEKNQSYTVDLLRECVNRKFPVKAMFVGDGNDLDQLKKKVSENGLDKFVVFVGATDNIEKFYQAFDMFIFPSLHEGLGIVALEAQASGLPVLCSENILEDVFVSDNIWKCELEDVDSWINQVDMFTKQASS